MYETYYGLREKPFDIVPNPDYLYLSRTHRQALNYIRYGLQERLGFVLMTGEVGSGKTTIIRELIRTMGTEMTVARIFTTRVNSSELLAMINEDFGLETAGKGKVQLLKELYAFLIQEHEQGRRPVLIVDEAQNLSLDLLEEVRMLSNLETTTTKLLQIIIAGQPELDTVLAHPEMRQFRQRVSITCCLKPLTRSEMEEYVLHRLEVAGNRQALVFTDEAFNAVFAASKGIPRQINTLCDFLLLTACIEERHEATAEMVRDVAGGIGLTAGSDYDGPGERGETPHLSDKSSLAGRLALLHALGVPSLDGEDDDPAINPFPQSAAGEHPLSIRSIGCRLKGIEERMARLAGVRRRNNHDRD